MEGILPHYKEVDWNIEVSVGTNPKIPNFGKPNSKLSEPELLRPNTELQTLW